MLKHTHTFNGPFSRTTRVRAGTRNVKPIWISLKQETVSGSGISWAICVYTSRQTDNHASIPPLSFFYRPDALPDAQPTAPNATTLRKKQKSANVKSLTKIV